MTSIWKVLTTIDQYTVIQTWHPKIDNVLRPLNTIDLAKTMKKQAVNDKFIELLQMGWFIANTKLRFRLGYIQPIASILEDPNLIYILNNHEAYLTRDNMQSIDTIISVWFGEPITEYATYTDRI